MKIAIMLVLSFIATIHITIACSSSPDLTETRTAELFATLEAAGTPHDAARATLETELAKTAIVRSEIAVAEALRKLNATRNDPEVDARIDASETAQAGVQELSRYTKDPKGIEIRKANPTLVEEIGKSALEVIRTSKAYLEINATAVAEAQTNAIVAIALEQDTKEAATALAKGHTTTFTNAFETAAAYTYATVEALLEAQE